MPEPGRQEPDEARTILAQLGPGAGGDLQGLRQAARTRSSGRARPTAPAWRRAAKVKLDVSKGPPLVAVPRVIDLPCQQAKQRPGEPGLPGDDRSSTRTASSGSRTRPRTRRCRRAPRSPSACCRDAGAPRGRSARTRPPPAGWRRPPCRTPTRPARGCVQVYVSNSRGWALPPGDPAQDALFRDGCAERGMPVFIHASLLVNLGSPTAGDGRAVGARRSPTRCAGARRSAPRGVVFHAGSAVDEGHAEAAMRQVREALLPLLDEAAGSGGPQLLVEPSAGGGRSLASRVEHLGPYLDAVDGHPVARRLLRHLPRLGGRARPGRRGRHDRDPGHAGGHGRRRTGCGWCTPTTRRTSAAPPGTGTRPSARAPSASRRSPS